MALALLAVSTAAHADGGERFVKAPGTALAVGFAMQDASLGGMHEAGLGAAAEGALGTGRTQFFVELAALSAKVDIPMDGPHGTFGRGGVGVRWLARQFQPERDFGVEFYLEAGAGIERFWWDGGGQLTRPDLALGVGMQTRIWEVHNITVRVGTRILFAPNDPASSWIACRGSGCPTSGAGSMAGFAGGFSLGW